MTKIVEEYMQLLDRVEHLKLDNIELGKKNKDLNERLGELRSENKRMTAMISEQYEITPDVARANSKLYQQGLRIRAMKAAIKDLKEKLAHKLSDGDVIELIRAYAKKRDEVEVLKRLIERIKDGTDQCRRNKPSAGAESGVERCL